MGVGRVGVEEGVAVEKGVTICPLEISKTKTVSNKRFSLRHRAGGWLWRSGALFERSAFVFDISKPQIRTFDSGQTHSTSRYLPSGVSSEPSHPHKYFSLMLVESSERASALPYCSFFVKLHEKPARGQVYTSLFFLSRPSN